MWIYIIVACLIYLLLTLLFTYLIHQLPRQPVQDAPDWGEVTDTRIPTSDGGSLEVWRVDPEGHSRGVVVLAPRIDVPVLLIHGSRDQNFPLHHVWRLMDSFPAGRSELFVATDSDHSSFSLTPEYPVDIKAFVDRHLPES